MSKYQIATSPSKMWTGPSKHLESIVAVNGANVDFLSKDLKLFQCQMSDYFVLWGNNIIESCNLFDEEWSGWLVFVTEIQKIGAQKAIAQYSLCLSRIGGSLFKINAWLTTLSLTDSLNPACGFTGGRERSFAAQATTEIRNL